MQAQAESSSLRDEVGKLRLDCKQTGRTQDSADLRLLQLQLYARAANVSRLEECAALREMSSEVGQGSHPGRRCFGLLVTQPVKSRRPVNSGT